MGVMKTEPQPSDREVLAGLVERVTYQNAENGFCVIRVKARGHRDLVTVVGHAAVISAGEWITASGDWTNDRTHGQQFKARFLKTSAPTSLDGIENAHTLGPAWGFDYKQGKATRRAAMLDQYGAVLCAACASSMRLATIEPGEAGTSMVMFECRYARISSKLVCLRMSDRTTGMVPWSISSIKWRRDRSGARGPPPRGGRDNDPGLGRSCA